MQNTIKGINTAVIKYENRFLALLIKTQQSDGRYQHYYLQVPELTSLLMILRNRMAIVAKRLIFEGEIYGKNLRAYSEALVSHTPKIETEELQQPNPERRVMSLMLKPGESISTLIATLQNDMIALLYIDDMLAGPLIVAIQQALIHGGETELIQYCASTVNHLMLYTSSLSNSAPMNYQQYPQDDWKQRLFTHHLAILFCFSTAEGEKILSGAIIRTSAEHPSEEENNIVMHTLEKYPMLQATRDDKRACQIFSRVISPQPEKILTREECLRSLHAFYLDTQASLNA
ncbi:YjeJ family protein [Kluyvera genomosp. 1]|uniref:YjeJ family protein n=1 Tax=Kluyvera genomosp. 1 TaxID=2774053 RepID=UPI0006917A69|nr:YjeJ family protein [Kluyvera genomosp. 1]